MSYTLDIVAPPVPADKHAAWDFLATLRERDDDEAPASAAMLALLKALTSVYPCLSSYAGDDPDADACPWSDGPMVGNLGAELATLGLSTRGDFGEVRGFLIRTAMALDMTVFDPQEGTIHRPGPVLPAGELHHISVTGIRDGFSKQHVVSRLATLFRRDEAQIGMLFEAGPACVRKGMGLLDAVVYHGVLAKAGCAAEIGPKPLEAAPRPPADYAAMRMPELRKLAAAGDARAMFQIGRSFELGFGVAEDPYQAFTWFQKAAELGDAEAQFALAAMYVEQHGKKGGADVVKQVNFWLEKAAAQGHEQAIKIHAMRAR